MAQDKAMASLCPVILQLEEHPSGSDSRKGQAGAKRLPSVLAFNGEGNSSDPSATAWPGPRVGGIHSLGRSRGHIRTLGDQF